jgi:hypothetical protein
MGSGGFPAPHQPGAEDRFYLPSPDEICLGQDNLRLASHRVRSNPQNRMFTTETQSAQ